MRGGSPFARILIVLGSSMYWAWFFNAFLAWSYFPTNVFDSGPAHLAYIASQTAIVFSVCFLVFAYRGKGFTIPSWFVLSSALALCATTLARSGLPVANHEETTLLLGIATGLLVPPLGMAWGTRSTLEGEKTSFVVVLSFLVAALLSYAIHLMPHDSRAAVIALLPLASALLWLYDRGHRPQHATMGSDAYQGEITEGDFSLKLIPWKTLSIFIVASFMNELITATLAQSSTAHAGVSEELGAIQECLFCCVLLAIIYVNHWHLDLTKAYRVLAPLIVFILLMLMLLRVGAPNFFVGLMRDSLYLLQVLIWAYLVDVTRKLGLSPVLSLGFAFVAIAAIVLTGNIGSMLLLHAFGYSDMLILILAVVEIMVLTVVLTRAPCTEPEQQVVAEQPLGAGALSSAVVEDKAIQAAYEALQQKKLDRFSDAYGLSAREREVFSCLLRGNTGAGIAEELFVTTGTVKTHISHIYKKLAVSSKQEAIDLYNSLEQTS